MWVHWQEASVLILPRLKKPQLQHKTQSLQEVHRMHLQLALKWLLPLVTLSYRNNWLTLKPQLHKLTQHWQLVT